MFTGLVQDVGVVDRVVPGGMTDLWIRTALGAASFALGESISVDGACLTVVE
ncbi:MAG TPA: riboflavin synthase, partial [Hyalangium sp.]|nr:riboflavin synthase [Hyalangium sp.]